MRAAPTTTAVLLVASLLALTACGKQRVDLTKVEARINAQIKSVDASLDCPDEVDQSSSFDCTLKVGDQRRTMRWKVAGKDGAELAPVDPAAYYRLVSPRR